MKLKVCHLITQLELGGAQRNTLYTVNTLNRERFDPILIYGPGGMLDEEIRYTPWTKKSISCLIRTVHPIKDIVALVKIYIYLRQTKPQILHTHSSKAGILGRIAGYFSGVPIIIHTFHGFGFTPGQSKLKKKSFIWMEQLCALLSTHLIFVSEANRSEATERNIGTNTPNSLIRSGISMSPDTKPTENQEDLQVGQKPRIESKGIREDKGISNDAWVVVSVGNFKPQKNPLDLAKVAEVVIRQEQDVHFLLVGDGELRPSVEAWVLEHGIQDKVHFLGWRRRRDDISEILRTSNCFLLTSLWEGLPRAMVEAAFAGKPIVAYDVDGVHDILQNGKNGFLIPPLDVQQAADKILSLKSNPTEALRMGTAAKQSIGDDFNIDNMVRAQEKLYLELYDRVPLKEAYGLPTLQ